MKGKECPNCGNIVKKMTTDGFHPCKSCGTLFSDFAVSKRSDDAPAHSLPMYRPLEKTLIAVILTLIFISLPAVLIISIMFYRGR